MADYELGMQNHPGVLERQQNAADRVKQVLLKHKSLPPKAKDTTSPQLALRMRPLSETLIKKPLSRHDILQISRNLRNTLLPNNLSIALQMLEQSLPNTAVKKQQAAMQTLKLRLQAQKHQMQLDAAELEYEQEHDNQYQEPKAYC